MNKELYSDIMKVVYLGDIASDQSALAQIAEYHKEKVENITLEFKELLELTRNKSVQDITKFSELNDRLINITVKGGIL